MSLDSYLVEGPGPHRQDVTLTCPKCGQEAEFRVEIEYGRFTLPDGAWCDDCGCYLEAS